jgi:hypothetical protein
VVKGVGNNLAVELAPFITYVADLMVDWAKEGGRAGSIVSQGIGWVTEGIGFAADAVQVLGVAFHGVQAVILQALSKVSEGIAEVTKDLEGIVQQNWVKGALGPVGLIWAEFGGEQRKALAESSSFFSDWAKDLDRQSGEAAASAVKAWDKPWAHAGVHEFVDNIKLQAQNRAQLSAGKESSFSAGGALDKIKTPEFHTAGALEMGSKEAYSAIVKSRGMQLNAMQNRIEANTRTTAEASTRAAVGIARIGDLLQGKQGGGKELGHQMTAGN